MKHLAPDYVYTPAGLQRNTCIAISDDGIIDSIFDLETHAIAPTNVDSLPGIALLPGFVNVHSHVFHRALGRHMGGIIDDCLRAGGFPASAGGGAAALL